MLLNHAEILDIIAYLNILFLQVRVHDEEQTTSAGFVDQLEPATELSSPDPDIEIMTKNSSSTSKYVRMPTLCDVLKCGKNITNEIVAEILSSENTILQEIALHDEQHRLRLLKTVVFSLISLKGKHLCRTQNIESSTMARHTNTKQVLFLHE